MTSEQLKDVNEVLDCIGIENVQNIAVIKYGATNGSIIKAVFPNEDIIESDGACVYVGTKMRFDKDWWNAPYKAESEGKE